ncbi:MAG: hypothetical protein MZV70_46570 [Desulfobacterales bacterium]|nr:hypothetical protein [Desulfobacterales bacterium]
MRFIAARGWPRRSSGSSANASDLNVQERAFLEASQALAEQETREREAQRQRELEAARKLAETGTRRGRGAGHRRAAITSSGAHFLAFASIAASPAGRCRHCGLGSALIKAKNLPPRANWLRQPSTTCKLTRSAV